MNFTPQARDDLDYITNTSELTQTDAVNQAVLISAELLRLVREGKTLEVFDPVTNKRAEMFIERH